MAYSPNPGPQDIVTYLRARGYSPAQAAALAGNIEQESGFNPGALNKNEGAYGLLQWRGPRLEGLNRYAASQGRDPSDWRTQLDYAQTEMNGPESKSAATFLGAQTVQDANAALRGYIRYGDNSEGRRLSNAQNYLPDGAQAAPLPPPVNVASAPTIAPPISGPQGPAQTQQARPQQSAGLVPNLAPFSWTPQPAASQQMQPLPQTPLLQNQLAQMAMLQPPPDTRGLQGLLQNSAPVFRGLLS